MVLSEENLHVDIRNALLTTGGLSNVSNDIISRCAALVSTMDMTPNELADCWAAFSINKNVKFLDSHSYESFRLQVIREFESSPGTEGVAVMTKERKRQVAVNVTPPSKKTNTSSSNKSMISDNNDITSMNRRVSFGPNVLDDGSRSLKTTSSFSSPSLVSYNPSDLPAIVQTSKWTKDMPVCKVSPCSQFSTNQCEVYKHMFTTLEERSMAIDEHLTELKNALIERYDLDVEDVGVPRQTKICCIGRICNASHEGRINATTVMLEGSRDEGGERVQLDLMSLKNSTTHLEKSYSLFPGQVVAVEGFNTTGQTMIAERIITGVPHPPVKTLKNDLIQFHHTDQNGAPLRIMLAAGPFTTSDNISYQPLHNFLNAVRLNKPDVVFLVGPFVDLRQSIILEGNVVVTAEDGVDLSVPYDTFFANIISSYLETLYYEEPDCITQFILVPSLDDAIAEYVFPQPPFEDKGSDNRSTIPGGEGLELGTLGLNGIMTGRSRTGKEEFKRIHCAPNPCTIKVNEIVIGITSTDILFDMNPNETNANLEPGSRLVRMSQHILDQRCYYPLHPAGMNNPYINLKKMRQMTIPCGLDILILPSRLKPFCQKVSNNDCNTIVVNPSHLCHNTMAGSYAIIDVHPIQREILDAAKNEEIWNDVHKRTVVEIKKIEDFSTIFNSGN